MLKVSSLTSCDFHLPIHTPAHRITPPCPSQEGSLVRHAPYSHIRTFSHPHICTSAHFLIRTFAHLHIYLSRCISLFTVPKDIFNSWLIWRWLRPRALSSAICLAMRSRQAAV
jgi:hypothetical protein